MAAPLPIWSLPGNSAACGWDGDRRTSAGRTGELLASSSNERFRAVASASLLLLLLDDAVSGAGV